MFSKLRFLATATVVILMMVPGAAAAKDLVVKPPPAALDKLYPPTSKQPKWIQQMHKLSTNFGGVFVNMREQDWDNAEKRAAQLVEAYEETSKLVPEWKDYFDLDAARKFAAAVKTRKPEEIGKASGPLAKTCGTCHHDNYVSVWTKYHWPSVEDIKITDPVTEKEFEYGKFMFQISGAFTGVTANFQEGQYDQAAKNLRVLQKRLRELRSTCAKCHTNAAVKQFFVGSAMDEALQGLGQELAAAKPNPGNFWKNVGALGTQTCKQCHLTHRAWAIIQSYWEQPGK